MKKNKKSKPKSNLKIKKPFFRLKTRAVLWALFSQAASFAAVLAVAVFGFEMALSGSVLFGVVVATLPFLLFNYLRFKSKSLFYLIEIAKLNDNAFFKKHFDIFISKDYASEIVSSEKFDKYDYSAIVLIRTLYPYGSPHLVPCALALIKLIEPGDESSNRVINALFRDSYTFSYDIKIMSALLKKGVVTDEYKSNALVLFLERRDLPMIKLLRLHNAKIDPSHQYATLLNEYNAAIDDSITEFSPQLHDILDNIDFSIQLEKERARRFPDCEESIEVLKTKPEILNAYNEIRKIPNRIRRNFQIELCTDEKWKKACTAAFKNA